MTEADRMRERIETFFAEASNEKQRLLDAEKILREKTRFYNMWLDWQTDVLLKEARDAGLNVLSVRAPGRA